SATRLRKRPECWHSPASATPFNPIPQVAPHGELFSTAMSGFPAIRHLPGSSGSGSRQSRGSWKARWAGRRISKAPWWARKSIWCNRVRNRAAWRVGKLMAASTHPRILALFQKRIEGDDSLLRLAGLRFRQTGLGTEVYAGTPDEL